MTRVGRRCPKPLPEAEQMEQTLRDASFPIPTPEAWLLAQGDDERAAHHRSAIARLSDSDKAAWVLAHMDLGGLPPRLRHGLLAPQRQLGRVLVERLRNLDADNAPAGPSNPYACPLLKVGPEAARWFGVVGFDGWGSPKSLTLDPLDEPQRTYEAALVICAERNRAVAKATPSQAKSPESAPSGASARRRR